MPPINNYYNEVILNDPTLTEGNPVSGHEIQVIVGSPSKVAKAKHRWRSPGDPMVAISIRMFRHCPDCRPLGNNAEAASRSLTELYDFWLNYQRRNRNVSVRRSALQESIGSKGTVKVVTQLGVYSG